MEIILDNLTPEVCDKVAILYPWQDIEFKCSNLNISNVVQDRLARSPVSIEMYLKSYLQGAIPETVANQNFDTSIMSDIQLLDYRYRSSNLEIESLFYEKSDLFQYRRAFIIAFYCGLESVLDLFVEKYTIEWFFPIIALVPDINNYLKQLNLSNIKISEDRSAKQIGEHFYIHEGSNYWNRVWLKNKTWDIKWENQLRTWQNQFKKTENQLKKIVKNDYSLLVVPEKDTIARTIAQDFKTGNALPLIFVQGVAELVDKNKFKFPLLELVQLSEDIRFKLPDSHLSGKDYWTIFCSIMLSWGYSDLISTVKCEYELINNYGDLGSKFSKFDGKRQILNIIKPKLGEPYVVGGVNEFKMPLKNCYVKWQNDKPLINKSVLILGDSHCSIGASPFLTYLFSKIFREVTFYWNPYFLNEIQLDEDRQFDYALSEIAQRFISPILI